MQMSRGFLPEPLPTGVVSTDRIVKEVAKLKERALVHMATDSPLFKDARLAAFRRMCANMTVEQAMSQYPGVFEDGFYDEVSVRLEDIRTMAWTFGSDLTPGTVAEMLGDARLFWRWIHYVVGAIAKAHFSKFTVTPMVVMSVPHLDVPLDSEDKAQVAIVFDDVYNADSEKYQDHAYVSEINWPGRQVLRVDDAWVDYIMYLMRVVCGFCN
jgi:hypothetical protein